jgi:hypothetical protein
VRVRVRVGVRVGARVRVRVRVGVKVKGNEDHHEELVKVRTYPLWVVIPCAKCTFSTVVP